LKALVLSIFYALSIASAFAEEGPKISDAMRIDPRHGTAFRAKPGLHRHPVSPTIEEQDLTNLKKTYFSLKNENSDERDFEVFLDSHAVGHFQSKCAEDRLHPLTPEAKVDTDGLVLDWTQRFKFYTYDRGWVTLIKQDAINFWGNPIEHRDFSTFTAFANQDERNIFHLDLKFGANGFPNAYRVRGYGIAEPVWFSDAPIKKADADEEKWRTKPLTYKTLGADVNNFYRVVGLPKNCICQFMSGQPAYSKNGHDFFYVSGHPKMFIEVEYSDEGQNIRRFRFIEKLSDTVRKDKFGGWQTENVRQHASDFTTGLSIVQLDNTRDPFEMPFASEPFSAKTWRSDEQHRPWFLFDIAHDYPLIGMRHDQVITILGAADDMSGARSDAHTEFDHVDKYVLRRSNEGISSIFKIAYKNEKVVAFGVAP
jgi:hypothetical protein